MADISYHRCKDHKVNRVAAWTFGTNVGPDRAVCTLVASSHYHLDGACLPTAYSDDALICGEDGCTRHLRPFNVRATMVPGVSCEAKCRTADGASCRCSCGGRQHGKERE